MRSRERLKSALAPAGFQIQDRSNGAPGTRRFIERLGQFLTLVGLAALIVAGIGVGNGVASYLDGKRGTIATLKLLGATSRTLFLSYLLQIGLVALGATVAGLAAGALIPAAVVADRRRCPAGAAAPLALRAAPARQRRLRPAHRRRLRAGADRPRPDGSGGDPVPRRPRAAAPPGWAAVIIVLAAAAAIAGLAVGTAREPAFAAGFIGSALGLVLMLTLLGGLIRWTASRLPRPRHPVFRIALANLHRPGAQTGRLVVALGLGLTLFTTLAVIESNLAGQIRTAIPARAPSFFLLDIPVERIGDFRALARRAAPAGDLVTIPSLRGSVVAIGGRRVADMAEIPPEAWFLRGDRGLTYSATLPQGSRIVAGQWWPPDYSGPPLVSLDVAAARAVGLKVGDPIIVSVLGREIEARIASLTRDQLGHDGLQLRHRLRPRNAGGRAAQLHGDDRHAGSAGAPLRPSRLAAPSRASRRSGSRRWSRRSRRCSRSSRRRCARRRRWRSSPGSRSGRSARRQPPRPHLRQRRPQDARSDARPDPRRPGRRILLLAMVVALVALGSEAPPAGGWW